MARPLATYNEDVMNTGCTRPQCMAQPGERCKGSMGYNVTPAHAVRIAAAGYRYDDSIKGLVKL